MKNQLNSNIQKAIHNAFRAIPRIISTQEYSIVLWILTLRKDDINFFQIGKTISNEILLLKSFEPEKYNYCISNNINADKCFELDDKVITKEFIKNRSYSYFKPIYNKVKGDVLDEILEELEKIDFKEFQLYFPEIFDFAMGLLSLYQGQSSGQYSQPRELSELVIELANLKENSKIYNPFAGYAGYGLLLDEKQHYYADELDHSTWALGQLRLKAHGKNFENYVNQDSIRNWNSNSKFDLVVTSPPLGKTIDKGILALDENLPLNYRLNKVSLENYLFTKGINSICENGQIVSVISSNFLSSLGKKGDYEFRSNLIQNNFINTIISLPMGLLPYTGVSLCIILIKKTCAKPGYIKLVEAGDLYLKDTKKRKLDVQKVLDEISLDKNSDIIKYVSHDEIIANDFDLTVSRYFIKKIQGDKLSEFASILNSTPNNSRNPTITNGLMEVPIAHIKNLNKDIFDSNFKIDHLPRDVFNSHRHKIISQSCLLVATRWSSVKPTYFEYDGKPIAISKNIVALRIDESKAIPQFLVNEFSKEYVLNQIESYRVGSVQPMLRNKDLLNIVFQLPSLEQQQSILKGLLEASLRHKVKTIGNELVLREQDSQEYDNFLSLKHSTGTARQNILSISKSMLRFFNSDDANAFEKLFSLYHQRYNTNFVDDLASIKNDIDHISTLFDKGEKGIDLKQFQLQPISISDIELELKRFTNVESKYNFTFNGLSKNEKKGKAIEADQALFKILIDNISTNTDKYAFENSSDANFVQIEMKLDEEKLIVTIKNNGLPFPDNYTQNDFVKKFSSTSTNPENGLGGNDIDRIAKYFNNPTWNLILDKNSLFPVEFIFSFPLISLDNE